MQLSTQSFWRPGWLLLTFRPPADEREAPRQPQILHESLSRLYKIGTGSVWRPINEPAADGAGPRFLNESLDPTSEGLRVSSGTNAEGGRTYSPVPREERESLMRLGMRSPKPGWGLALSYYLGQYELLCQRGDDCCSEFTGWKRERAAETPG